MLGTRKQNKINLIIQKSFTRIKWLSERKRWNNATDNFWKVNLNRKSKTINDWNLALIQINVSGPKKWWLLNLRT